MADDMGFGDPECYNPDSKIPTQNMNRLAEKGLRFTDAHASSAVCTPSRYSVLTGQYCWRTRRKMGVNGGLSLPLIDNTRQTIASMLKNSGYRTGAVGKWHVGLHWQVKEGRLDKFDPENWRDEGYVDYAKPILDGPLQHGFDSFFGIAGSIDMPPYAYIENDRTLGIPDIPKKIYYPQQKEGFQTGDWEDTEVDMVFTEKACEFIDAAADGAQPFFLYLTPASPHRPCQPPKFATGKSKAGNRGDMVWLVDWVLGRVMDKLDEKGIAENTIVIITSDNGARPCDVDGEMWNHKTNGDLRGYKCDVWDGGHRVPFILRWPAQVKAATVSDDLVGIFDTFATMAEINGVALADNQCEDGVSFLPILEGKEGLRKDMVHHSYAGMFAYRQDNWKLIDGLGGNQPLAPVINGPTGQLFDLANDYSEKDNLWFEEQERAKLLAKNLEDLKRTKRVI